MTLLLLAGALLLCAAAVALLPRVPAIGLGARFDPASLVALVACILGAASATHALVTGAVEHWRVAWDVPGGAFALHLDALSALFLLPVFVLGALGIVYGRGYWERPGAPQPRAGWAWYHLFVASMALVVLAANAVLFLVAWEAMSVTAFFLVTHEDDDAAVRQAGWTFLIAAHLGTAFLLAMFAVLGRGAGTLDFDQLRGAAAGGPAAGAVVLLALAGFGTKAGLVPGHVWLPAAHPAAPSHVSALMSGAMLKVGIYGLVRTLMLLPQTPPWAGWLILVIGLVSGVYGVLMALAQHDLKRLLAFSSVENIGIICIGIGVGLLGVSYGVPAVAALGFAGAFLHVLNHALFKGLLFFGAGAVARATGTRELDLLGGLLRQMPWTGATFFVGAIAISGLPPLSGFASEFLIYVAAVRGGASVDRGMAIAMLCVIGGLALIGGLAAACFAKAFGVVFLGQPRSAAAAAPAECPGAMRWPMVALAAACVAIGLVPIAALRLVREAVVEVSGLPRETSLAAIGGASALLARLALLGALVLALVLVLAWWRRRLLAARTVYAPTWATAYAAPNPRMQYTAASFADPLTNLFHPVVRLHAEIVAVTGYFAQGGSYHTRARGLFLGPIFERVFATVAQAAGRLRWLQHGRIQLYLVNIGATLVALLIWKLGIAP